MSEILSTGQKDAIVMNRFSLASSIQSTLHHLSLKRWTPQQQPFALALIKLLEQEKDELIKLGLSELTLSSHANTSKE